MKIQQSINHLNICNPVVQKRLIAFSTLSHKKIGLIASAVFSGLALVCLFFCYSRKIKKSKKTNVNLDQKVNQLSPHPKKDPQLSLTELDNLKNKNDGLLSQGKIEEAEQNWQEIFTKNSNSSIIVEQYIKVLFKNGENLFDQWKLTEALKKYKIVMNLEPQNIAAAIKYAEILNLQGKFAQAEEKFKEILTSKLDPQTKRYVLTCCADALLNQEKFKEAEEKLKEVLKENGKDSLALGRLVVTLLSQQKLDKDKALIKYDEVLALNSKEVFSLIELAWTSRFVNDITLEEVEEKMKEAYLLDPKLAFRDYVQSLYTNKKHEEAIKIVQDILALDPENMIAREFYVRGLFDNDENMKCLEQCELGLNIDPNNKEILEYYFLIVENLNDFETTESIYQKYILKNTENYFVLKLYAEYLEEQKKSDSIPEKFREVLKLNLKFKTI